MGCFMELKLLLTELQPFELSHYRFAKYNRAWTKIYIHVFFFKFHTQILSSAFGALIVK